jgi:hypothetical protein
MAVAMTAPWDRRSGEGGLAGLCNDENPQGYRCSFPCDEGSFQFDVLLLRIPISRGNEEARS